VLLVGAAGGCCWWCCSVLAWAAWLGGFFHLGEQTLLLLVQPRNVQQQWGRQGGGAYHRWQGRAS
jgi:hypothetical protein